MMHGTTHTNREQATVRNQIINWINLQATDANAFIGECHIAFLSYAAILKLNIARHKSIILF